MLATPHHKRAVATAAVCIALSACSVLQSDKIDYKSASKGTSLEVPPDLTQLNRESRYQIPVANGILAGASTGENATAQPSLAAITLGDVRIERSGNQRWLVVKRPPEALWGAIRDFWKSSGFSLTTDDASIGIMETDWAEDRAKLPQDFIRNALGRIFDQLYSTGERDRFRTRLERLPSGETEIYVSHRGLTETVMPASIGQSSSTLWVARDANPELEAEILRRMMVSLGVAGDQSKAIMAAAANNRPAPTVQVVGQNASVTIPEKFDVAWRRVGLALDRTGFTVVDRDRNQGLYFVSYVPPSADFKEPGFFSKLFTGAKKENPVRKYRVKVAAADAHCAISVQNEAGAPADLEDAKKILSLLAQDLR